MKISKFLQLAFLILLAAGAQPAYSAFYQWSKTSASNANADPSINWAEGMSPSSVNDSARAMMARAAEYRDDISGLLTAGGTSTAYTVTTNQGLNATPNDGQLLAFTPTLSNGGATTLVADGGNAFPIQSSAGSAIGAGTLLAGTPYTVKFNAVAAAWVLRDFYGNTSIPLGGILWSTMSTAPNSNFVTPSGQCISTTTYATYWVAMGSPASGGCPGGQFALIDMRGRVAAALDTLNASAANRLTTATNGCGTAMTSVGATCGNGVESTTLATTNLPPYTPTGTVTTTIGNMPMQGFAQSGSVVLTAASFGSNNGGSSALALTAGASSSFAGVAQGGASTPISRVQPTIGLIPYLRIL